MEKLENFKVQVGIIMFAQLVAIIGFYVTGFENVAKALFCFFIINLAIVMWVFMRLEKDKLNRELDISRILGRDAKDALLFGEIGILTYDDQYMVTWTNEFLDQRGIDIVGKKVTAWIHEINDLFYGDVDRITAHDGDYIYEITRKDNAQVLYIRDVTKLEDLAERFDREQVVIGLLQLDNYMEIQQYEDETMMANINTNLRQPVSEWAKSYGMLVRRMRSDRFLVVLNEATYDKVKEDKFSILQQIRKAAEDIDVQITLSMAFARGTSDLHELDEMVSSLLELAQSRGGDQVAVKRYGESVKYYGGASEAQEKHSRVRVRVMAQAIKEAIQDADKVFIVGHKEMDFDCMGSALGVSRMGSSYGREAYIVSKGGGIESQLSEALDLYSKVLEERHTFISDTEACKISGKNDLVIAVDHHNPQQSGAPLIIEKLSKVIVIDHHRRSENFIDNPLLVYVESGASSVSELVTELLPYQTQKVDVCEEEATIMYLGILIDTNRFKSRTGSRTFEAAAVLKKMGVDPITAENLLKEDFCDFEAKTQVLKYARKYNGSTIIAAVEDKQILSRTLMSQVADQLLNIKGIEAAFVIAKIDEETSAVSARSKGVMNVQIIMEKMQGGGHFTAAALQRKETTVSAIEKELQETIDAYLKEESGNESNTAK